MKKTSMKKALKNKSAIGDWVTFHKKDDKGYGFRGICVDEAVVISGDYAHRFQKIVWSQERLTPKGEWKNCKKGKIRSAVRSCYYVISSARDKIVFGQYCMTSYPEVVGKLSSTAKKKGFYKKMTQNQMQKELNKFY